MASYATEQKKIENLIVFFCEKFARYIKNFRENKIWMKCMKIFLMLKINHWTNVIKKKKFKVYY